MIKKFLALGIIFLFIFSGLGTYPITAQSQISINKSSENKDIISEDIANYPDLISDSTYWIEVDPIFGRRHYHYEITIINIGEDIAIKPDGHALFKWYSKYTDGSIRETYHENKSLELSPGEQLKFDYYVDIFIVGYKSYHIVTVDPDNVVDEGINGEKNNIETFTLPRSREKSNINKIKIFDYLNNGITKIYGIVQPIFSKGQTTLDKSIMNEGGINKLEGPFIIFESSPMATIAIQFKVWLDHESVTYIISGGNVITLFIFKFGLIGWWAGKYLLPFVDRLHLYDEGNGVKMSLVNYFIPNIGLYAHIEAQ